MKLKTGKYLYLLCLITFAFAGCKNNNDAPAVTTNTSVNVVNLVTDASAINYYDNGTRQNPYKLDYGLQSEYLTVISGDQIATIKDSLYNTIYSNTLTLTSGTLNTLLITGQAQKTISAILLRDTAVSVTGKARARFVNASANAPALDVYFNKLLVSSTVFKAISPVTTVDTGTVAIKIALAGQTTGFYNTSVKLSGGGVYTFYAYGLYQGTGTTAFTLSGIANH